MAIFGGLIRLVLAVALGGLVTKGILTLDDFEKLVSLVTGALGIIGVGVWSIATNKIKGLIEQAAANHEVKKIETTPTIASEVESPKVVPADPLEDIE